jgi:subtilase family serine protease
MLVGGPAISATAARRTGVSKRGIRRAASTSHGATPGADWHRRIKEEWIMRRALVTVRVAALVGACAAGGCAASAPAPAAPASATSAATESQTTQVWLAGRQQAAQSLVDAASTPGSRNYHRFLSPSAYTRRFGPSAAQVTAVESYLTGAGFTQVRASVNDVYVSAVPPSGSKVTIPDSIRRDVLAVTGAGTKSGTAKTAGTATAPAALSQVSAKGAACSKYWAQKTQTIRPAFEGLTRAAVTVCGYSARQIRAAYGLTSADTGAGKTIALIEIGAPDDMLRALTDYAKANGLPAPRPGQFREEAISQGGKDPKCINPATEESAIDSEAAYATAPGARQLMVDGDDCDQSNDGAQALFDAMLEPLTGHGSRASVSIENVCFFIDAGAPNLPSLLKINHAIALRAAAEGVTMVDAAGDSPGIEPASEDPDVTAVGGTTLGIGARNQRVFETGWSTRFGERTGTSGPWHNEGILLGTGGGASDVYGEPGYQKGIVPSSMARNQAGKLGRTVPDISADADPYSPMLFGFITTRPNGKTTPYTPFRQAGTSTATPLIAGIVADGEQGQRANFGFLNPLLYSLAGTPAYHDILPVSPSAPPVDRAVYATGDTDINKKFAPGFVLGINDAQDVSGPHQVTAPGYDTMTGLGTPNGSALIQGLRSGR